MRIREGTKRDDGTKERRNEETDSTIVEAMGRKDGRRRKRKRLGLKRRGEAQKDGNPRVGGGGD